MPARPVHAGTTYLITRRTTRRTFLMRPDQKMTELFWYLLGVYTRKHGVIVHCVQCLSTHYHAVRACCRSTSRSCTARWR